MSESFSACVCVCVSQSVCLCACDGDEVKGGLPSTLVYVCILLGSPCCKEEASFHSLFAFQCILYTPGDPVKCEENRPSAMSE